MPKRRGREHTTLTETAALVVRELEKLPDIKMIAPGEIKTTRRGKVGRRHVTVVTTPAGCELLITGQSVQKVAVHVSDVQRIIQQLQTAKALRGFTVSERFRLPGQ